MADEVTQEIKEGKAQARTLKQRLLSPPVIAVGVALVILAGGAVFMLTSPPRSEAGAKSERNSAEAFRNATEGLTVYPVGEVTVQVPFGKSMGERKVLAAFELEVTVALLGSLDDAQLETLRSRTRGVIQGVLYNRAHDVKTDPKQARLRIAEDVKRALIQGRDPSDAELRVELPFTEGNLERVHVSNLEISSF